MDAHDVIDRLRTVEDPHLDGDIVELGVVRSVNVDSHIHIELALEAKGSAKEASIIDAVKQALEHTNIPLTIDRVQPSGHDPASDVRGSVANVIAVASGKGGVGKTTVSVNLAAGLAASGAAVGLFDADVYGPNAPMMLAGEERPTVSDDGQLIPPEAFGMKVMSMAYLVGEDDPIIWRGPMVHKVLTQLWDDVAWGELDYLVIDLPPGTGDTQLTLLQTIPLTGAVIVTTPQDVALHDATKGLEMFARHETNVLGIVENMAGFRCPDCGSVHEIFDAGGGERLAEVHDLPFLGSIPLDPTIRTGDRPVVLDGEEESATKFQELASLVADNVGIVNRRRLEPSLLGDQAE